MNRRVYFLAVVALGALLRPLDSWAVELTISCGSVGVELKLCKSATAAWASATGNSVKVVSTPNSSSERLALYQQLLAAGADDIDVFQIDVVWPGLLFNHLVDLSPYLQGASREHFPAVIENDTVQGRLVAMPWFTVAGVLFYRKDLLAKYGQKPPVTWDELTVVARTVQQGERAAGNDKMWGFVWQGRAYEGLTCDALEWIASQDGGTIVDAAGKVTVDNPRAKVAIERAAGWVGTISPPGVLNYAEEEARGVFQAGNAVFMRNWPYAWALAQNEESPIKGKVGVVRLPQGSADGSHAAVLGGWQLAVSKYSKHPKTAADLVGYLTSPEVQRQRAIVGAYSPSIVALYQDQDVLAANPFFQTLHRILDAAVARPSSVTGTKYNQVSNAFWNAVHDVLSGKQGASISLKRLRSRLIRMSRNGKAW